MNKAIGQEKILVLIQNTRRDLDTIVSIYEALGQHPLHADTDRDALIVSAYRFHNLYNAFENIFQNIAAVFENSIDNIAQWHSQLLERMRLNLLPLRPAVIDDTAYEALDELRRFRHLFRHAYSVQFDPLRLQLVQTKAMALKAIYASQLEQFLEFLQGLMSS